MSCFVRQRTACFSHWDATRVSGSSECSDANDPGSSSSSSSSIQQGSQESNGSVDGSHVVSYGREFWRYQPTGLVFFGMTEFQEFQMNFIPEDPPIFFMSLPTYFHVSSETQHQLFLLTHSRSSRSEAIRSSERRQNSRILEEDSMRSMPPSPVRRGTSVWP